MNPSAAKAAGAGHEVAIGLGSNLGPSLALLATVWRELRECPALTPLALSAPYRSQPLDMASDNWFVNAAALVRTPLAPDALLRLLQTLETRHGRDRGAGTGGYRDRTLDLDLLLYDDLVLTTEDLIIPHPRLARRLFVLAPLAEIAADRRHPGLGRTIGALLAELQQTDHGQSVERISWPERLAACAPAGRGKKKTAGTNQLDF
ncbi:2-amino-4-hydroxy-6-hydroxymethyldihydropteridine diphosphokinase [Desulfobulbus elongatus]|uniref:2-amino-4-hydroxy-6- hydroxymethyldihydropteridine diphosphokinase n=1 Tax=Desulfobulbus elongatus TaxID=53332 RepID=UPI000A0481E9|nr:2-amino-4-hydroxy-6-hydroxymethyldihydropteridine diphosphokinase [Desulfobulbus elongatus]